MGERRLGEAGEREGSFSSGMGSGGWCAVRPWLDKLLLRIERREEGILTLGGLKADDAGGGLLGKSFTEAAEPLRLWLAGASWATSSE